MAKADLMAMMPLGMRHPSLCRRLARSEEAVRRLQAESEAAQERERQLRLEVGPGAGPGSGC